jgi:Flp pilus assembly protein TadD
VADRYLYLPSLFPLWFLGVACESIFSRKWGRLGLAFILGPFFLSFLARDIQGSFRWRDAFSLWDGAGTNIAHPEMVFCEKGSALADRGKHPEAIDFFKKALQVRDDFPLAHNNLGLSYGSLGQRDLARGHLERAILLDRNFALAYNNLGCLFLEMGELEAAETQLKLALEKAPDMAKALNNLGIIRGKKGDLGEARRFFEKALEKNPGDPAIQRNIIYTQKLEAQSQHKGPGSRDF